MVHDLFLLSYFFNVEWCESGSRVRMGGGGVAGFCRLVQFSVGSVSIQLSSGFQMPFCMSTVFGKWGKEGDGRK